jgi:hypothetical protein
MPGRPDHGKGIVQFPGMDQFDGPANASGCQQGRFMRKWGCPGFLIQIGAVLSFRILQASNVLRGMDLEKLFLFSFSWCNVSKITPHVGRLHHGMERLKPIGTFRMVGARAMISVALILDNAGSSGRIHHFFPYLSNTRLGWKNIITDQNSTTLSFV